MYNKIIKMQTPIICCICKSTAILAVLLIVLATLPVASAVGVVTSCDIDGNKVDQFAPGESIYVKATGLSTNKDYKIWIQDDPVNEDDTLISGENPSSAVTPKDVTTDGDGNFGPTLIWSIPLDAPVTHYGYDIVVDRQKTGINTGKYGHTYDGLDSASVAGIVAPVPDVSSLILFASGLVLVLVYFVYGRRRKEEEKK